MERFSELSEDVIEKFNEIFNTKSFPTPIEFQFINDSKQKNLIKIAKIPQEYSYLLDKELKVSVNEELINVYDDQSIRILFEQEIDKIYLNPDTGKIKLVKTDLNTFSSLVNKYGVEDVTKANKTEELYQQQKKDRKEGEVVDNTEKDNFLV